MIDNRSSFYFFLSVKNEDQSVFFPCKGHVTTGLQGIYQAQRLQLKYKTGNKTICLNIFTAIGLTVKVNFLAISIIIFILSLKIDFKSTFKSIFIVIKCGGKKIFVNILNQK